jgi:hypothetical protein
MQDRGQHEYKQLPVLNKEIDVAEVMMYKRRWHQLVEYASRFVDKWDSIEDKIPSAINKAKKSLSKKELGDMIETAMQAWSALEKWTDNPLKKETEKLFLRAAFPVKYRLDIFIEKSFRIIRKIKKLN